MALFNRKHTKPQYVFQPGTRVAVHTLGITFIFEGDNVRLLVEKFDRPKMWRSDDALLPSGKRSLALNVSTRDEMAQSYTLTTPPPIQTEATSTKRRLAHTTSGS